MTLEIKAVSTTISCQISGGEGHLSAEIDSRPYGLNGGRTQYFEGDTAYVLVYKSANVEILGTRVTGGNFVADPSATVGYNIVREGITFNSPIASSSKPLPMVTPVTSIAQVTIGDCSGFEYVKGTTVMRLNHWKGTGDPAAPPLIGFDFIEYSPEAIVYKFTNLPAPPSGQIFSYPVHAFIYGVARPLPMHFSAL
jgi:hypothetical protein